MESGQEWALLSAQNATPPVLTLSTQPPPTPPCRPLSNSTASWKLLYSLPWVQTMSHSRPRLSLIPPRTWPGLAPWQVLRGVRGPTGREQGAPRPKILGAAPSPEPVSLSCSHLTAPLTDTHVPSHHSLLESGCSLRPPRSAGEPGGGVSGTGGSLGGSQRFPRSHKEVGVTLAWRHRGPSVLTPLSLPGSVL